MTRTRHGHHIPGTPLGLEPPPETARCGGIKGCSACSKDAAGATPKNTTEEYLSVMVGEPTDYPQLAKYAVREYLETTVPTGWISTSYTIYVITFSKTLRNWKALVGTTAADGEIYEVTFNGETRETYVDIYGRKGQYIVKAKQAPVSTTGTQVEVSNVTRTVLIGGKPVKQVERFMRDSRGDLVRSWQDVD